MKMTCPFSPIYLFIQLFISVWTYGNVPYSLGYILRTSSEVLDEVFSVTGVSQFKPQLLRVEQLRSWLWTSQTGFKFWLPLSLLSWATYLSPWASQSYQGQSKGDGNTWKEGCWVMYGTGGVD